MSKQFELDAQKAVVLYRDVMELIKVRQDCSRNMKDWCISTQFKYVPGGACTEFLYLQLRMICESIALACLIAHNDISETKKKDIYGNWNAAEIIARLERLHTDFYPRPIKQITDSEGKVVGVSPIESGYLTKERFLTLYAECGKWLHVGSLKKNLQPMQTGAVTLEPIVLWHNEITELLNAHWIPLANGKGQLWTLLQVKPHNNARVDLYLNGPPAPFVA